VHVTRVDKRGKRMNEIQLTTVKGEASDVAIAWAGGGWVIVWVDGRDGNGEVYATKVGVDLSRIARGERITRAPGDATDGAGAGGRDGCRGRGEQGRRLGRVGGPAREPDRWLR